MISTCPSIRKIQYLAYSHLKQAVSDFNAKAGGVVVIDTKTGEILALANWPTYNPNNRERLTGAQLRNRAFTDTYEPGSVMKPFTAALALENSKVRFDTVIDCSPGRLTIGTATISDAHRHGPLTVAQVIQKSSNVGTAKIAAMLTPEQMWNMYDAIGLGQAPGLGFPGEVGRASAALEILAADRASDHVLRARTVPVADATGSCLYGFRS